MELAPFTFTQFISKVFLIFMVLSEKYTINYKRWFTMLLNIEPKV